MVLRSSLVGLNQRHSQAETRLVWGHGSGRLGSVQVQSRHDLPSLHGGNLHLALQIHKESLQCACLIWPTPSFRVWGSKHCESLSAEKDLDHPFEGFLAEVVELPAEAGVLVKAQHLVAHNDKYVFYDHRAMLSWRVAFSFRSSVFLVEAVVHMLLVMIGIATITATSVVLILAFCSRHKERSEAQTQCESCYT